MKKQNDLTLQDAMKSMLREYRLDNQVNETRVKAIWEQVMGKTIATYTSNISVQKNVLYLTIVSAPLKQELMYAKDAIRKRVNEAVGEEYIREVVVR
jgi:predicted nucleic acid-binding Zn ribbon protein